MLSRNSIITGYQPRKYMHPVIFLSFESEKKAPFVHETIHIIAWDWHTIWLKEGLAVFLNDKLRLPFKPKSFNTIIRINLLHVLKDASRILNQLTRVVTDSGTMSLTFMILNNRLPDRYLYAIASTGAAIPRTAEQLISLFDDANMPVEYNLKGNMAFVQYN